MCIRDSDRGIRHFPSRGQQAGGGGKRPLDGEGLSLIHIFFLKNPRDLDAFAQEAYAAGLSEYDKLSTDAVVYYAFVKPVEQMGAISLIFLCVVDRKSTRLNSSHRL